MNTPRLVFLGAAALWLLGALGCTEPAPSASADAIATDAASPVDVAALDGETPTPDAAPGDADSSSPPDAGPADATSLDAGPADGTPPDAAAPDAAAAGPVRSPGCGLAPPEGMTPGTHTVDDFSGGGRDDRVYVVTIPEGYDPARPYALTLGLHPGGSRARPLYDLDETMAGESINVYGQSLNDRGTWDKTGDDDVPYLDDLVRFFKDRFCVDERRVFVAGFSQGARMAAALGCRRGDLFRAVGALSAGPPGATEGDVAIEQCVGQTAYFHINGLEDPERAPLLAYYINMWRTRNGCGDETEPFAPEPCVAYLGCDAPVVQCEPPGLRHQNWRPGGASPFGMWFLQL